MPSFCPVHDISGRRQSGAATELYSNEDDNDNDNEIDAEGVRHGPNIVQAVVDVGRVINKVQNVLFIV